MTDDDLLEDEITRKLRVDSNLLANLRATMVVEVKGIKTWLHSMTWGCVIGISPTDCVIDKYTPIELTQSIRNIFKSLRKRSSTGALVPVAPLSVAIVGEYSPKHRWHYHGLITVDNIDTLNKIKKILNKKIGRTVTEQLTNQVIYIDYMFKQYTTDDDVNNYFYPWDKDKCFTALVRAKEVT